MTKEWTISATITAARQDGYSYVLVTDEGKTLISGRRLLKAIRNDSSHQQDTNTEHYPATSRTSYHAPNNQQPISQQLAPQKMQKRSARPKQGAGTALCQPTLPSPKRQGKCPARILQRTEGCTWAAALGQRSTTESPPTNGHPCCFWSS